MPQTSLYVRAVWLETISFWRLQFKIPRVPKMGKARPLSVPQM